MLERAGRSKPEKTLFVVSSKSGSTTEPNAFLAYFYDQVKKKKGQKAGENFVAITDPGTQMERIAKEKNFRHIVLNPADIGGRYSALSYFGMLPAALMGIDAMALLEGALDMAGRVRAARARVAKSGRGARRRARTPRERRPQQAHVLSVERHRLRRHVARTVDRRKHGQGRERDCSCRIRNLMLEASKYAADRIFVSIQTKPNLPLRKKLQALKKAGHPVIDIVIPGKNAVAGEFFRWEFATAVAGAVIGIDPFDQPNVQESKDLTKEYLERYETGGSLGAPSPLFEIDKFAIYSSHAAIRGSDATELLSSLVNTMRSGDWRRDVGLILNATRRTRRRCKKSVNIF